MSMDGNVDGNQRVACSPFDNWILWSAAIFLS
jgi:hypothetical protein